MLGIVKVNFSSALAYSQLSVFRFPFSVFTFSSSAMEIALHKCKHLLAVVTDVGSQGAVVI